MNNSILKEHYDDILKREETYAIVWINIKNFRFYNTKYGQKGGNEILSIIERSFQSLMRDGDICYHTTADNYIAIMQYPNSDAFLNAYLIPIANDMYRIDDERIYRELFLSYGVYQIEEQHVSFEDACNLANLARRQSKSLHKRFQSIELYEDHFFHAYMDHHELEVRTSEAYKNYEFTTFLQPKVDTKTHKIVGAEALLRWIDKDGKQVPLYKFLPILNQNGYIELVDIDTFDFMCKMMQERQDAGKKNVPISFNISKSTFYSPDVIEIYVDVFKKYNLPKHLIEIELMESISLDDTARLKEVTEGFHDVGFACSLDDFGNGYSSFNVLLNANLNAVKMDRQFFLKNLNGDSSLIITSIIQLLKSLHLKIVAEGVELQEHVDLLTQCECDMIQGYYFYKPMPAEEFYALLDNQT